MDFEHVSTERKPSKNISESISTLGNNNMADVYYESLFLSGYNKGTNLISSDSKSLTRNSSNKFENFE